MRLKRLGNRASQLDELVENFAEALYNSLSGPVRLVSHLDADGLSSAGVMIRLLSRLNVPYHLSVEKYLSPELVEKLSSESYEVYIFTDMGSGELNLLSSLKGKTFVIDHHNIAGGVGNVHLLNPFLSGLDGDVEVSGAGTAFLLYYEMFEDLEPVVQAITGALGDLQDRNEFKGLNKELVELAIKEGILEIRKDIRLFGGPDYPLVSALERTTDPYLEGISDNSSGALKLVESLGIPVKIGDRWVTLSDLTEDQKRDLLNELVKRAGGLEEAKNLVGPVYLNLGEPPDSPLRELRSFSTLLNACGRMGKGFLGALLSAGFRGKVLEEALETLKEYRRELSETVKRVKENLRREGNVVFIDEGEVKDTIIGTVASILSNEVEADLIVGYAKTDGGMLKVSARLVKKGSVDLSDLLKKASESVGGVGGGHKNAAGAQIPEEGKRKFEETLLKFLS